MKERAVNIKGLLLIVCCMALLLASCRSTTDFSSNGMQDGEEITRLIGRQEKSSLDETRGTLHHRRATATPWGGQATPTQETATPTHSSTLIATATPAPITSTPIPSSTSSQLPGACYVAPVDETANLQVYAGPAYSHPVIGTAQPGQYYHATGQLPLELAERFIQIDFNGVPGWVDASHYMFDGDGCWPIPTLDTWPTPIVTSTPSPFPTLSPTSTLSPEINPAQVTDTPSAIGSTVQIIGSLPSTDGKTTAAAAIRVNFGPLEVGPYDGVRMLNVLVQCTGVNPQNLRWGYYGSETDIECGRYIDTGVSQGGNLLILALAVPADGMTAAYYTITITVNAP